MKEQYFFADVDLPFHVWVRESCGQRGYRWVLRDATPLQGGAAHTRSASELPASRRPAGTAG